MVFRKFANFQTISCIRVVYYGAQFLVPYMSHSLHHQAIFPTSQKTMRYAILHQISWCFHMTWLFSIAYINFSKISGIVLCNTLIVYIHKWNKMMWQCRQYMIKADMKDEYTSFEYPSLRNKCWQHQLVAMVLSEAWQALLFFNWHPACLDFLSSTYMSIAPNILVTVTDQL